MREKLARIPLLGMYFNFSAHDYLDAFRELSVTMIFSLAPLWVGTFKLHFFDNMSYYQAMKSLYSSGQLLCYSAAFLGPVIYAISKDRDMRRRFPNKWWFLIFAVFVTFISPFAFQTNSLNIVIFPDILVSCSEKIFIFSIIVYFSTLVIENWLKDNPSSKMVKDTTQFVDAVNRRRRE